MIHFFTGKGGVGKSHVASLFKKEHDLALYSFEPLRGETAKDSKSLYLDPKACLREYLLLKLKMRKAVDLIMNTRLFSHLFDAAPGVDAIATSGKVFEEGKSKDLVVDAPASGHFIPWISTAKSFAKVIPFGPIHEDCIEMTKMFYSKQTSTIHVVCLPQEIVVEETLELIEDLKKEGLPLGKIWMNKIITLDFESTDKESLEGLFQAKKEQQEAILKHFPYPFERVAWEL